tara:strand:- start:888 stop:1934 length:1047 start_codon:yes stop_codon:yes gene_type:complete
MLEEAIIDAAALKEAAIKNAENVIVEKYSADIKEAVESLLEGEEEIEISNEENQAQDEIPVAATPPATDEEMVIDFEDLKNIISAVEEKEQEIGQDLMGEPESHTEIAAEMHVDAQAPSLETPPPTEVPVTVTLEEGAELQTETPCDAGDEDFDGLDEDIDLEEVLDIMEELVVDIMPQKEGWVGTPDDVMNYKAEMMLAKKASTESQEELKVQRDLVKRLALENKQLKEANTEYKKLIVEANERIEKSNLTNARLLYTNRVMTNDSLNERQKTKIVEAVQNADSIEAAKTIFETLQSAVGGTNKSTPKSLSETIERPVGSLPRRKRENNMETQVVDRMQILAGIKQQ